MRVLAIPMHNVQPRTFTNEAAAAKYFNTSEAIVKNCIESGLPFVRCDRTWFFDEAYDFRAHYMRTYTFENVETKERVSVTGGAEFLKWSGYKTLGTLQRGEDIHNRLDGEIYRLVED